MITYDNDIFAGASTSVTSKTTAYTCSGENRVLIVGLRTTSGAGDVCTGITYAGVSMTRIDTGVGQDGWQEYTYILINPTVGTNNLVVSISASGTIAPSIVSFNGCDQTSQPDAHGEVSKGASTTFEPNITTINDNAVIVLYCSQPYTAQTYTAGANTTQLTGGYILSFYGGPFTPEGVNNLNVSSSANSAWHGLQLSLKPAVASGPANLKSWNGLAKASIKSINGLAIASIKSINSLE